MATGVSGEKVLATGVISRLQAFTQRPCAFVLRISPTSEYINHSILCLDLASWLYRISHRIPKYMLDRDLQSTLSTELHR